MPSRPMAVGTVFHGLVEFRQERGRWPSRREFDKMPGNYSAPSDAVRQFGEEVFAEGEKLAYFVEEERPDLLECPEGCLVEFDVGTLGIEFYENGPTAQGYLDIFLPEERTIRDWKCRGSFRYILRTPEEFKKNVQLSYYAALVARHYDWPDVTVEHLNVLRTDKGGPAIQQTSYKLERDFLDEVWHEMVSSIVPGMDDVYSEDVEKKVTRNTASCWNYGGCTHRKYCLPAEDESSPVQDALAMIAGAT